MKKRYIAILGIAGLSVWGKARWDKIWLQGKDFKKAQWGLYDNVEGQLNYECYMEKGHYKGSINKANYLFYSDLVNHDKRTGKIWLPDLDGDGLIGNKKPEKWVSGEEIFKRLEK